MSTIGAMKHHLEKYDPEIIHGTKVGIKEIDELSLTLKTKTLCEKKKIKGLQPERAGFTLAGTEILKLVMKKLCIDTVVISDRGLRHALVFDRFLTE